jgi:hypothetical protein
VDWAITPPIFGYLAATTAPDWQTIGSMIVGTLGLLGVLHTGARSRASSREANAVSWSKDLVARIETLERRDAEKNDKIDQLQDAQRETAAIITAFTYFTERLFRWGRGGGGEPEPTIPTELRERLHHLIHDHQES